MLASLTSGRDALTFGSLTLCDELLACSEQVLVLLLFFCQAVVQLSHLALELGLNVSKFVILALELLQALLQAEGLLLLCIAL